MIKEPSLEDAIKRLTTEFGEIALDELRARFGDAATTRPEAVNFHACALRARGTVFQESRNHL